MTIHVRPDLAAILEKQVAAGHFDTVEEALEAAILGLEIDAASDDDLAWAKPFLAEADKAIAEGRTLSEADTFADLEKRFGKL